MEVEGINNDWTNDDLQEFYENIPVEELKDFAQAASLDGCCDLDLVEEYIKKAQAILEVGAGYGRVVKKILEQGSGKKVVAIERSKNLCHYLQKQFDKKVEIVNGDIRDYNFKNKFDLILLMWSNIAEYPKEQQKNLLSRLKCLLNNRGIIVVDTIKHTLKPAKMDDFKDQTYTVKFDYGTAHGYLPTPEEIEAYCQETGLLIEKRIFYTTLTNKNRIIYIITSL